MCRTKSMENRDGSGGENGTHTGAGKEREGNKGREREEERERPSKAGGGPPWLLEARGSSVRPIGLPQ